MTNTEILERKGLSEEDIRSLEDICLDTKEILIKYDVPEETAETLAIILEGNEKIKRKMHASTPIEGRYDRYVEQFHSLTSEYEWAKRRVEFEVEYFISLTDEIHDNYKGKKRKLTHRKCAENERKTLRNLYKNFSEKDFRIIQILDNKFIKHDIVAMTTWMVYELGDSMADLKEDTEAAIHFALTSEDVNANVYNSIARDLIAKAYIPAVISIQESLIKKAESYDPKTENKDEPFAAQTHGQYAHYTTLRKVFANFVSAIGKKLCKFIDTNSRPIKLSGKLGGAVGNSNDIITAYPDHDWLGFNRRFIENTLGFEYNAVCDQADFNLKNQEIYNNIRDLNNEVIKVCSDFWRYCSRGLFKKITKKGESGSSVMAQKANPWQSEGAEEYLEEANEQFLGYERLIKYRMQGDLKRSIQMRGIGEPFAKTVIALKRVVEEMNNYEPNFGAIAREVELHPEMSAAAVQTILRREGIPEAYDILKGMTMGKPIERKDYESLAGKLFADGKISPQTQDEIISIVNPTNNLGYANELADNALLNATHTINMLRKAYQIREAK